jgi:hypothetical protein
MLGGFQDGSEREEAESEPPIVKSWRDTGDTLCSQRRESLRHIKRRNQEGTRATSRPCSDSLGRRRPGELRGTTVLPQTSLGQSSTAPWKD